MRIAAAVLLGVSMSPAAVAQTAADAYYDPSEMAAARAALKSHHGGQVNSLILGERLEVQGSDGDAQSVWEAQAWIGGDIHKLWLKTEGEYDHSDGQFGEAEVQALYSRAISPFWDLQLGLRHDVRPDPSRSYAVIGLQGLAPYWFEIDGQLFVSENGKVSMRLEAEYELRLTQRLILQPRLEVSGAFSKDEPAIDGSGVSAAELGLRLRYEFRREIAPYVGVGWHRSFGRTREIQEAEGDSGQEAVWIAGLRWWF